MTSSQQNLKDIVDELRVLRGKMEKLENIVEKRLVGAVNPDRHERGAISEFEKKQKSGKAKFIPLSEIE